MVGLVRNTILVFLGIDYIKLENRLIYIKTNNPNIYKLDCRTKIVKRTSNTDENC